jgi:hypothetical protein
VSHPRIAARRIALGAVCLLAIASGCGSDTTAPDVTPATVSVATAAPATLAVGRLVTPAPTVVVRNRAGAPLSGVPVVFTVDAGGGTLATSTVTTGTDGTASAAWTLGRNVGPNRVLATVAGLPPVAFNVDAVAGPPVQMFTVGGRQTVYGGRALSIGVAIVDEFDNPIVGMPVTFTPLNGTSVSPTTVNTDRFGVASARWTVPSAPGDVRLTASAGTLAPLEFVATIVPTVAACPSLGALAPGSSVTGTLSAGDCTQIGGTYYDAYTLHLGAQSAFTVTMTSSDIDPLLSLYEGAIDNSASAVATNDDISQTNLDAAITVIAGPGDYFLGAEEFEPQSGGYSLTVSTAAMDIASCAEVFVVPNVTLAQNLASTDCPDAGSYADDMIVYLNQGDQLDVTMSSTAFDAKLELEGEIASNEFEISDDNSGGGTNARLQITAPVSDFYGIRATSASTGKTGAYTLTINRTAAANASVASARAPIPVTARREKAATLWRRWHVSESARELLAPR